MACWAFAKLTRLPVPGAAALRRGRHRLPVRPLASRSTAATSPPPWRASSPSRSRCPSPSLFLGVVGRGCETGRHRALAAAAPRPHRALPPHPGDLRHRRHRRVAAGVAASAARAGARGSGGCSVPAWSAARSPPGGSCRSVCASAYMNDMGWEKMHPLRRPACAAGEDLDSQLVELAADRVGPRCSPCSASCCRSPGSAGPVASSSLMALVRRPSGSGSCRRRPALERPAAALLLPVPLPAGRRRCGRARPHAGRARLAPIRSSPAARSPRPRPSSARCSSSSPWRCRCGRCRTPSASARQRRARRHPRRRLVPLAVPVDHGQQLRAARGPAGTSPATRARPPYPEYHEHRADDGRPRRRPTAAAGRCGSTRSSTTATARRWR